MTSSKSIATNQSPKEDHLKTITIIGAGYVGLTTAALLAHSGYRVYAVESNKERLDVIKKGRSFFFEQGLNPVIKDAIDKGTLISTDSYSQSIPKSSVVFSSVGTPDNPDGSSNLSYVFSAAEEAALYMKPDSIYVQKSTVPVGTGKHIEEAFKKSNKHISYISNPEFLREGTALYDTLCFDRVVVGGDDKAAVKHVLDIYRQLEKCRNAIAKLAKVDISKARKGQYIATGLNSAELIKVTSNAFLALKISFANSIAKLADQVNADIVEVMDAVGADERIGRAFLNAGRGYGGGCFPKDVSGLITSGMQNGVDLEIMNAAQELNKSMPGYIAEKLQNKLGGLKDRKIAVLGLAFKAGTSDTRRSPGVQLANLIKKAGASVNSFDPQASKEAADDLRKGVIQNQSIEEAIKGADAIIISTDWPQFISYSPEKYSKAMGKEKVFVDAVNGFSIPEIEQAGLTYVGVGR